MVIDQDQLPVCEGLSLNGADGLEDLLGSLIVDAGQYADGRHGVNSFFPVSFFEAGKSFPLRDKKARG